ncbi:alpha/beta hydrolase [Microbulbifer sp. OS29]|uniref:Alpha/beta hydrolase n=1 Tax=Microbulbifer okhotskensis TaxID=2926617 RepID=A0A9X2ELX3_9GAMM|nr:alpha/beta hydrolase [Microbulbifer okhotskensis]MCO1334642.1 alpha/beta hydrolase [Microbulbifer okhotskensis]
MSSILYDGEALETVAGFPVLYHYIPANESNPLIIFVPGTAHLARIFYGYPDGKIEDFVAYWVNKADFPFLAISYPMANEVFGSTHPDFTIADWGLQVAEVIAKVITEYQLPKSVIVCGWSMGGKIAGALGRAAAEQSFNIDMFVAIAAEPALPGFLPAANSQAVKMTEEGMASREGIYPAFYAAMDEQDKYNDHTIIPRKIYRSQFLGAVPIALIGTGLMYRDFSFKEDLASALTTANTFGYLDYALPVVIQSDSMGDLENVLCNVDDWAFIRNRVLVKKILGNKPTDQVSRKEWELIKLLTRSSSEYFSQTVSGNHFCFVGSVGARSIVDKILTLYARVCSINHIVN